jgi:hypothetical protein
MRYGNVKNNYTVLGVNSEGDIDENEDDPEIAIDQFYGERLEIWKQRKSDGFLFVYSRRLEIGYWVLPDHINEN